MEDFVLARPSPAYAGQLAEYRAEFLEAGDSMDGTNRLRRFEDMAEYIRYCADCENPADADDRAPATQFLFVRVSDGRLVGMIQVRHCLNDYLRTFGGHIGYCVRPSERRKGYAKAMLKAVLPFCREIGIEKVLVTCLDGNTGSEKTILSGGGVYESTVYEPELKADVKRFWISL